MHEPHEKGAGQQHRGMLGRALCLLPLQCPWASYVSPLSPVAAPSALDLDIPRRSFTDSSQYLRLYIAESNCEKP